VHHLSTKVDMHRTTVADSVHFTTFARQLWATCRAV